MTTRTSTLHLRINADTKEQASRVLTAMGLSMSDAVRMFLCRVVIEQAFPLELKVPNAVTIKAMEESRAMMAKHPARFASADEMCVDLENTSNKQA